MTDETASRISVAVVDDHVLVAEMLALTISKETDLRLAGVAPSMFDAYALVDHEEPDVLLMDSRLLDDDGIEVVTRILERQPEARLVMLTGSGGHDLLARAIEAGCVGLIDRDRPVGEVLAAVRAAARGELVIRSKEFSGLLSQIRMTPNRRTHLLTPFELQVLELLAKGRSTEVIAEDLHVSLHAVPTHVTSILGKLGVHSIFEAVAIAAREKLISVVGVD